MTKVRLDNIFPISKTNQLKRHLRDTITEGNKIGYENFNSLLNFLNQNRKELEEKIDITKSIDSENKKPRYYQQKGILLSKIEDRSRSSSGRTVFFCDEQKFIFYIPSKKHFLQVTKLHDGVYACHGGRDTTETIGCKKINRNQFIKKIDLQTLTENLAGFLNSNKNQRGIFSNFYHQIPISKYANLYM